MKIILANGTELNAILVTGETRYLQGANRDALTFVFDDSLGLAEIDALFNETNCETITIITESEEVLEDGSTKIVETENVHSAYVVRVDIRKTREITQQATANTDEVSEQRIEVTMAQRTYAETKLAEIEAQNMDTALAVAELGVMIAGGAE